MKNTQLRQISPKGFAKTLLGIPMSLISYVLEREERELSENIYFYSPLEYSFELWLLVLKHVTTLQSRLKCESF